jgi:hypothetical protein
LNKNGRITSCQLARFANYLRKNSGVKKYQRSEGRSQRSEDSSQKPKAGGAEGSSQSTEEIMQLESAKDLDAYKLANAFAMEIFEITKGFHRKKNTR